MAVDADFLIVPGLHEKLSGADAARALLEDLTMRRQVVVLPAFETDAALGIEQGAQIAIRAQTGKPSDSGLWPSHALCSSTKTLLVYNATQICLSMCNPPSPPPRSSLQSVHAANIWDAQAGMPAAYSVLQAGVL